MDNLTQAQYQSILRYMQDYHEDNFQQAYKIMNQYNFDIENVRNNVNVRGNNHDDIRGNALHEEIQNDDQQLYEEQQEQISKMRSYLLRRVQVRRNNSKITQYTRCIKNLCLRITQVLVPEMIKRKIIRSQFYQIYQDQSVIELKNKNISQALQRSKASHHTNLINANINIRGNRNIMNINKKSLFVIISENGKNHCILEFLKKKKLLNKIAQEYQIVGLIDTELEGQLCQLYPQMQNRKNRNLQPKLPSFYYNTENTTNMSINNNSSNKKINQNSTSPSSQNQHIQIYPPSILVLRERHTQDIQLIQHFYHEKQISQIDEDILKKLNDKTKESIEKQTILLRRITQRLFQESYQVMQMRLGDNMHVQNVNRNQQEHEHVEPQENAQRFIKNRQQSKIIAQQNQQYLELQRKKRQKQQSLQKRQQQLQNYLQQRQCRKLSLPDEPIQNQIGSQNIIKITFRCPNGQNISRKFHKKQKLEILYHWVELNDQIEFQGDQSMGGMMKQNKNNGYEALNITGQTLSIRKNSQQKIITQDRKFDLLFSYPPESLRDKSGMFLSDVFQGQDLVKILIRQL